MNRVIDLFAGCGGLSLGLKHAGFEVIAAFDNWKKSLDVYRANFNHEVHELDLSDVDSTISLLGNYDFEVIAGGPPCQDFSSAGKRDIKGGRADLTYRFSEIVCRAMPRFFIMENVERIKNSRILIDIIEEFAKVGYGLTAVILDASYCGVPQSRERFFLVGAHGEKHNFLLENLKSKLSDKPMSVREYLGQELEIDYYYRHPRNYNRRGIYSLDEPSATIRGVNRPVPPGYKKHVNDFQKADFEKLRPLTTFERSRIQTFPPDFKWIGSKTDQEQMIGNAVPVALAQFVGSALMEFKNGPSLVSSEFLEFELGQNILLPLRSLHKGINEFSHITPIGATTKRTKGGLDK